MARDMADDTYYASAGGKIPLKWTAPEVSENYWMPKTILQLTCT